MVVNHKSNHRAKIIFYQAIFIFINTGNITQGEVCVSLGENRFVVKLGKIFQKILMPLNHYILK